MEHLQTKHMTSDILTKPLAGTPYLHLRPLLLGIANYVCKKSVFSYKYICILTFKF